MRLQPIPQSKNEYMPTDAMIIVNLFRSSFYVLMSSHCFCVSVFQFFNFKKNQCQFESNSLCISADICLYAHIFQFHRTFNVQNTCHFILNLYLSVHLRIDAIFFLSLSLVYSRCMSIDINTGTFRAIEQTN